MRASSTDSDATGTAAITTGTGTFTIMPYFVNTEVLVPWSVNFAIIGHIYWGAIIGIAGGYFAQWLVQHEQRDVTPRTINRPAE